MPRQPNALNFDVRAALYAMIGGDLTRIHGIGPCLALKLVGECGTDLSKWPSTKHFTSWLCLAPGNKISGGKVLSSHPRRSKNRATALLRLAAVNVGKTDSAPRAFYRRLAVRIGKAKADIVEYIAMFCNSRRLHSYPGYQSPDEFERNGPMADAA